MKRSFWLLLIVAATFSFSCSSHKNLVNTNSTSSPSVRDGSSFDKAIIINEDHERPGIDAEYAWIKRQYPGSATKGQALMYNDNKPYDLIHVVTADGKTVDVYFDISKFFGKF